MRRIFVVGGAGFIGSHFLDALLARRETESVAVFDNFSSGQEWHYAHHRGDTRLRVVRGDVKDLPALKEAMAPVGGKPYDAVIHLASNPDIAKAMTDPTVDFWEGTYLTQNVAEAVRTSLVKTVLYASGSGIYGDVGKLEASELGILRDEQGKVVASDRADAPIHPPVSTYGASKQAGEGIFASYAAMFDISAIAFRFGNVVGPRQTHGVGYDFVRRLKADPTKLRVLGDGTQSKSYIYVTDVVAAVLLAGEKLGGRPGAFDVYNVATGDYITVKEIADLAVEVAGLKPGAVKYEFSGGNRGWKGDVPVVRLNTARIQTLGWRCSRTSRQALKDSMTAMLGEL